MQINHLQDQFLEMRSLIKEYVFKIKNIKKIKNMKHATLFSKYKNFSSFQ